MVVAVVATIVAVTAVVAVEIAATVVVVVALVGLWSAVHTTDERPPSIAPAAPGAVVAPTRAPVVVAPPVDAASTSERDQVLDVVRASGPANEPWDAQARSLFESIDPSVSIDGCYVAGCAATFTFASEASYDARRRDAERSTEYAAWTGGKRWTAPVVTGSKVAVSLVLYRPD